MGDVKWIKLSTDLFNNRKIRQIKRMDEGDSITLIWVELLILAGQLNNGGEIYFMEGVPFTEEQLAYHLERPREQLALALRTFEAYGMIENNDGVISICNWEKYQNATELEELKKRNKERQQKWRDKKKEERNVNVMLRNDTDKIRIDKNREDKIYTSSPDELQRSLLNRWRTNVDGSEANKEIRNG